MGITKRAVIIGIILFVAVSLTVTWLLFTKQEDKPTVAPPEEVQQEGTVVDAVADSEPMPDDGVAEGEAIRVNQTGYLTGFPKTAIVIGSGGSTEFHLRDAESHAIVFTGTLGESRSDASSGDDVRLADFSEFEGEGQFIVQSLGSGRSYPFTIRADVYQDTLVKLLRSYTLQRAGTDIQDHVTGLSLKAGHERDKQAKLFFSDDLGVAGEVVDVFGGWYDAGDYGKYVPPAAIAVGQLLLAYELRPEAFTKGQMQFPDNLENPEGTENMPDLLTEVRVSLEWLIKMQRADGSVYHKVSGGAWPGFVPPVEDFQERYVYGMSTFGTAQFAGALAIAARIYEEYDAEFAARLLQHAVKAQDYLEQNPASVFRYDVGQDSGSGAYAKDGDKEERFWAAAELFRTTKEARYGELLKQTYTDLIIREPQAASWSDASSLGQWAYYANEQADPELKEQLVSSFIAAADQMVANIEADGYRNVLISGEYTWASVKTGAARGNLLLLADRMKPDVRYIAGALDQLHYILGRSATGYSYVTGIGSKFASKPHHRIMAITGKVLPGYVVGGPNEYGTDTEIERIKLSVPPAKAYADTLESFSSNEYAVDYNAPVVLLLAHFQ